MADDPVPSVKPAELSPAKVITCISFATTVGDSTEKENEGLRVAVGRLLTEESPEVVREAVEEAETDVDAEVKGVLDRVGADLVLVVEGERGTEAKPDEEEEGDNEAADLVLVVEGERGTEAKTDLEEEGDNEAVPVAAVTTGVVGAGVAVIVENIVVARGVRVP